MMTATIEEIKKLLKFYFSPINLRYDAYLKHLIGPNFDRSVEIEALLKFNKIKALTSNKNDVFSALEETQIFKLNEGKTGFTLTPEYINKNLCLSDDEIKRLHEFQDKCTLYVTNFRPEQEPSGSTLEVDVLITCFTYFGHVAYAAKIKGLSSRSRDPSGSRDAAPIVQSAFVVFHRPEPIAEVFAFIASGLGLKRYLHERQKRRSSNNSDSSSQPEVTPCSRAQNKRSLTPHDAGLSSEERLTLAPLATFNKRFRHKGTSIDNAYAHASKISSNCVESLTLARSEASKKRSRDEEFTKNDPKRLTLDAHASEISSSLKPLLSNNEDASIKKRLTLDAATPQARHFISHPEKRVCLNGYKNLEKFKFCAKTLENSCHIEKNPDDLKAHLLKNLDVKINEEKDCENLGKKFCCSETKVVNTIDLSSEIEGDNKMDLHKRNRHHKRTGKSMATAIRILRSATLMTKSAWLESNHHSKTSSLGSLIKRVKDVMKQRDVDKGRSAAIPPISKSQFLDHNFAPNYHTLAIYNSMGRRLVCEQELKEQLNALGIKDFEIKSVPGIEPANARTSQRQPLAFVTTPSSLERDNILKLHWFDFSFRPIESNPIKNYGNSQRILKGGNVNPRPSHKKHGRNRRLRRTANFITRKRSPAVDLKN